jgi:hypothetical protein
VLASLIFSLAIVSANAEAQPDVETRVRSDARGVNELLADAARRSPTVRVLIERLQETDVIVYVRPRPFAPQTLAGQLTFVTAADDWRYVLVEIGCTESWDTQLATLGHELQHAVEIGEASWVRSTDDLAAFYRISGSVSSYTPGHETFETNAAIDVGRQVMRELRGRANATGTEAYGPKPTGVAMYPR